MTTIRRWVWRSRLATRVFRLRLRNRVSRSRVAGGDGPIVSLTSYGGRIASCHITIESIGRGSVKPERLLLWLDDQSALLDLPPSLRRLRRRGLEVLPTNDFGPHKKYFPYVESAADLAGSLVTADDDVIYPKWWLARFVVESGRTPDHVLSYRVRRIRMGADGTLAPYGSWELTTDPEPSLLHFATGVSGVLYPARMLVALKARGRSFGETCPRADDVWLHHTAIRNGVLVRQIDATSRTFPIIEHVQTIGLKHDNVGNCHNDAQIAATYSGADVENLRAAAGMTRDGVQ